uniref:Uncharacterized protein n=1 Tax=Ciona intestinalis TaxID=7719 RepID=H2Y0I0_CIOIN
MQRAQKTLKILDSILQIARITCLLALVANSYRLLNALERGYNLKMGKWKDSKIIFLYLDTIVTPSRLYTPLKEVSRINPILHLVKHTMAVLRQLTCQITLKDNLYIGCYIKLSKKVSLLGLACVKHLSSIELCLRTYLIKQTQQEGKNVMDILIPIT